MALLSSNRLPHRPFREPEADGQRPAILVVDDSEDDLALAQIMLQKDGYKILTASDTRQAFELLNSKRISMRDFRPVHAADEWRGFSAASKADVPPSRAHHVQRRQ